ncbi:MAG: hypothetical protein ACRDH5_15450, partial [bacterium]
MHRSPLPIAFTVLLILASTPGRELRAERLPGSRPLLRVRVDYRVPISGGRDVHQDFFVDAVPIEGSAFAVGHVTKG